MYIERAATLVPGWHIDKNEGLSLKYNDLFNVVTACLVYSKKHPRQQTAKGVWSHSLEFSTSEGLQIGYISPCLQVVVVQLLSCVWLFVTRWTAAHQASLAFTISWSFLRLMSIELMMPSCCPFSFCPQSFPASGSFPMSWLFTLVGQSTGASASASVLLMKFQGWFLLGFTGLISLLSKGLSRGFSSTIVRKHPFFGAQPSLWSNSHICAWLLGKP